MIVIGTAVVENYFGDHAGHRGIKAARSQYDLGVEHLYMFGSTARGEANPDSDVDLFDYQKGKLGSQLWTSRNTADLGRKTDIMTRDSLHKTLRQAIEATAVRVF